MWMMLSFSLMYSLDFTGLCNPDISNGWDYLLCVKNRVIEQVRKVEPGPEQAEAFTYAFAEINRAQRKMFEENEDGTLEDWRAALMMSHSFEYMGDLSALGGDVEKARLITEYALILTAGTGEELYKRQKIARYSGADEIAVLEGIINRAGCLNEGLTRGRADSDIIRSLSIRYARKGRYQDALDLNEKYLEWIIENDHPPAQGSWEDYAKLIKKAKPKHDAKKREKMKKKYLKLLEKEFLYSEYRDSRKAEEAILAENWRRYLEMDNTERRMAIRAMDY